MFLYVNGPAFELKTGAHMSQLIRTKAGPFTYKNMHSLQELKDAYIFYKQGNDILLRKIILPIESALAHLPKIFVFDSTIESLCHGNSLAIQGISKLESNIKENDLVAVFSLKNELVCLGKALLTSEDIIKNEKGLALKTEKVFMKPGTYPKITTKKE